MGEDAVLDVLDALELDAELLLDGRGHGLDLIRKQLLFWGFFSGNWFFVENYLLRVAADGYEGVVVVVESHQVAKKEVETRK